MNRPPRRARWVVAVALAVLGVTAAAARGATLRVGPGQKYAKPSEAFRAAKPGDVIEIDAGGSYGGDVARVNADRLTIRGVGGKPGDRAKVAADGRHAAGKGIWVISGTGVTVENMEFSGARVPDHNGAGIRGEGTDLTIRNCRFFDCENGILARDRGTLLVEHCEFDRCGHSTDQATHSIYVAGAERLIFRFNYSTRTLDGHLVKSRAKESWVMYNRLTDEDGGGSAVVDIPDGGVAVILGNVMHKGPKASNTRVVAYGMERMSHARNALYVVHNTMVYANRRRNAEFVRTENVADAFVPVIRNNLCAGPIPLTNHLKPDAAGNVLVPSAEAAGLTDPAAYDYRPRAGSPAVDKGVDPGKAGDASLRPEWQYVHPLRNEPRPDSDRQPDAGAYELGRK